MEQTQINEIENLLNKVGEKVDKANEIARLKGENFNIFTILGVETKENKTHSNFLVSLLNPKGSHGMGSTFLNLFYDELDNINLTSDKEDILKLMKFEDATIRAEENLGNVDYINESGGRVDITIKSSVGNIFIENKIHAGDQHLQIARYCENHIEEKNIVLYLTLDGKKPSESSSGKNYNLDEDFFLLSYQTNIINWLEKCQKEASDLPIIRETIKQYIILIKKLTGQLTSQKMEEEVTKIIKNNFKNAFAISNNINNAKAEIIEDTLKKLENKLSSKLDTNSWEFIRRKRVDETWSTFSVKLKSVDNVYISLQGNNSFLSGKRRLGITGLESRLSELKESQGFKKSKGVWSLYKEHNFGNDEFINYSDEYIDNLEVDFLFLSKIIQDLLND